MNRKDGDIRATRVEFRISPENKKKLRTMAFACGVSVSDLLTFFIEENYKESEETCGRSLRIRKVAPKNNCI